MTISFRIDRGDLDKLDALVARGGDAFAVGVDDRSAAIRAAIRQYIETFRLPKSDEGTAAAGS